MTEEEAVQLPPSLLQLSGSLVVDGQLITSITRRSSQHRLDADVKKNPDQTSASERIPKHRLMFFTLESIKTLRHPTATTGNVSLRQ